MIENYYQIIGKMIDENDDDLYENSDILRIFYVVYKRRMIACVSLHQKPQSFFTG